MRKGSDKRKTDKKRWVGSAAGEGGRRRASREETRRGLWGRDDGRGRRPRKKHVLAGRQREERLIGMASCVSRPGGTWRLGYAPTGQADPLAAHAQPSTARHRRRGPGARCMWWLAWNKRLDGHRRPV